MLRLGNPLSPSENAEIVYNETHPNNNDVEVDGLNPGTLYQIIVTNVAADGETKSRNVSEITGNAVGLKCFSIFYNDVT